VIVMSLLLVVAVLAALPKPRTSGIPLAPDNPSSGGARAVAQILAGQGVAVDFVRTTASAVADATEGSTLLITSDYMLDDAQLADLAATKADLVIVGPSVTALSVLTDGRVDRRWTDTSASTLLTARCSDPDATAAGQITVRDSGLRSVDGSGTVCFPSDDPAVGAYLALDGPRRISILASPDPLTNASLATAGNAALALRMLGRHDRLTWYVPSAEDTGTDEVASAGLSDLLPPAAGLVGLQLLIVAGFAALWRGRRLGRLVTEPLPVVVRASETVRGRGRLYRRSRSFGHAAAALRAGAARRSAARIGLPRSARADAVIDALARATGRRTDDVAALLYGPPPTDDIGLAQLARRLDELESEVHRT
jgi:Domain of unknown function (DUF4350)